jgi:hypothetical protein
MEGGPPWFVQTIVTRGGEFDYKFLCRTISKYIIILVKSSCVDRGQHGEVRYGHTYRHTMHYDPTKGHTIGTEATTLANYYQCHEDMEGKMEFTNIGAGIGGVFENTIELKPMKYGEAINEPDGKAWEKKN